MTFASNWPPPPLKRTCVHQSRHTVGTDQTYQYKGIYPNWLLVEINYSPTLPVLFVAVGGKFGGGGGWVYINYSVQKVTM